MNAHMPPAAHYDWDSLAVFAAACERKAPLANETRNPATAPNAAPTLAKPQPLRALTDSGHTRHNEHVYHGYAQRRWWKNPHQTGRSWSATIRLVDTLQPGAVRLNRVHPPRPAPPLLPDATTGPRRGSSGSRRSRFTCCGPGDGRVRLDACFLPDEHVNFYRVIPRTVRQHGRKRARGYRPTRRGRPQAMFYVYPTPVQIDLTRHDAELTKLWRLHAVMGAQVVADLAGTATRSCSWRPRPTW